jgi:hypothetical protein
MCSMEQTKNRAVGVNKLIDTLHFSPQREFGYNLGWSLVHMMCRLHYDQLGHCIIA